MYDWGACALVYPHPDTNRACSIPTAHLRALGLKADDNEMRKNLPRADASRIAGLR